MYPVSSEEFPEIIMSGRAFYSIPDIFGDLYITHSLRNRWSHGFRYHIGI
mgnify:CR=1 FL=1